MKGPAILAAALALAACRDDKVPVTPLVVAPVPERQADRFRVEVVSSFDDRSAYNGYRSVYVITDTQTGQRFIGVSGVGISELGSHMNGKTAAQDER